MSEELMKIVVVGGCEIGKTALSSKYIRNEYTASYTATIGVDFGCKNETVSGTTCTLQIWDTAGPGKKLDLISLYYGGAHAILLCFDITYEASFQEAKTTFFNWIEKRAPANTPIILVGTKSDLKEDRCVLREDIDTFVNAHNNIKKYIECSAKDNIEVKKVFQTAAEYGLNMLLESKGEAKTVVKHIVKQQEQQHKTKLLLTVTLPIVALLAVPIMMKNSQYVEMLSKLITGGKFSVAVASALSVVAVIGAICLVKDIYKAFVRLC